jgi:exodeoxyribonuclease-1
MPLAQHPVNANEVICYDLGVDPSALLELDAESIRQRLFVASDKLDGERIALKTIRANRCPVVATERLVDDAVAQRLRIDRASCERHRQLLLAARDLPAKLRDVFAAPEREEITDPERMLYSGGFFSAADRVAMQRVTQTEGLALAHQVFVFEDRRLPELLWRYRARNFPETLTPDEREDWLQFCRRRLTDPAAGAGIVLDAYRKRVAELEAMPQSESKQHVLRDLMLHANELMARCAQEIAAT